MWKTIRGEGEGDGRPLGPDRRERGRKASESEPFPQSLIFFIQPIFHWPVQLASHLNSRYLCVTLFPCFPSSWFISFFPFFQLFGTQRKRERRVRMCGSYIRALLARKTKEHPLYSTFQLLHPRCAIKNRPFTFTDVCNTAAE